MTWLGVLVAVTVLAAGIVKEIRSGRRAPWRFVALLVVAAALLVLILEPTRDALSDRQAAWVLTPVASQAEMRQQGPNLGPETLSVALPGAPSRSSSTENSPDLATFLRRHPEVDRLRILGAGLEPWDLEDLAPTVTADADVSLGPGIRTVSWSRRLGIGEWLEITGSFSGTAGSVLTLQLAGPGASQDEVELRFDRGAETQAFSLRTLPPGVGRFLYRVSVSGKEGAASQTELIDVQVEAPTLPAVLWLEDAPSFETRHLESWLSGLGAELAIRSRVSRDRYRSDFLNMERITLSRLTWEVLDRFDLVIVEQRAWNRLGRSEGALLKEAVAERGLGLIVRLDPRVEEESAGVWPLGFAGRRIPDLERLRVHAPGPAGAAASPVEIAPFELALDRGMTPLFSDRSGRVLAARRPSGAGSIAATLLRGTYAWVLEGDSQSHQTIWRKLLREVSRPQDQPFWQLPVGPILVDEPLVVSLQSQLEAAELPSARLVLPGGSAVPVALRGDAALAGRWSTTLWPLETGWHRLESAEASLEFHVVGAGTWHRWQEERRWRATRLAALRAQDESPREEVPVRIPWPRLPFFLVLLVGLGLLWLDERRPHPGGSSSTQGRRGETRPR